MKIKKKTALALIRLKMKTLSLVSSQKAATTAFALFCTPFQASRKKATPIFDQAEDLSLPLNGLILRGYGWNHTTGKNVLLLHGFSSNIYNFEHFVQPLLQLGYGILAFDAPAHGRSDGKRVNAVEYAQMITTIIRQYGPLEGAIGHSFGGLALCLAMEREQQSPIPKIVLIAPAAETTTAIDNAFALLKLSNPRVRQAFDDYITQFSGHPPHWYSIRRTLPHLQAQVLWVQDADDDITPVRDVQPAEKDAHQHVQFHHTQGLGHHKIYRDEAVVDKILQFFLC